MLSCNAVTMATVICDLPYFIRHCLLISDFLNTEKKKKIPTQTNKTTQGRGIIWSDAVSNTQTISCPLIFLYVKSNIHICKMLLDYICISYYIYISASKLNFVKRKCICTTDKPDTINFTLSRSHFELSKYIPCSCMGFYTTHFSMSVLWIRQFD